MSTILNQKGRSQGEMEAMEVAEESRETTWEYPSFAADLFMGKIRQSAMFPFPLQNEEDKKIGDAFCAKLDSYLKTVDSDQIDREKQIPSDVMKKLAELGCFGMKIHKKYGGLGLSQINYLRALAVVNRYDSSIAATLSAHQSIGVPQPLNLFGTEEQKAKYLPMFAKGAVSAFALTEPEVGSDPARMSTTATLTDDGKHYLINGKKLWCTNGVIADVIVVMALSPSIMVKGKEKKQITAFIVETNTPGIKVLHRCDFMGLNGIQNGLIEFDNVKIPKENIIWGLGKGLRLALVTLNAGRLSLPACCVGGAKEILGYSRDWAQTRHQWGTTIGKHEAVSNKLASMNAMTFALESITLLAGHWVDHKSQDIRLEAAMCKIYSSVHSHRYLEEAIQIRGGRGYENAISLKERGEKPYPLERMYRDSRINQIVEGTSEILRLFIAREALDKHLKLAGDVLNPKLSIVKRLTTAVKAGLFYAVWFPWQWIQTSWFPKNSGLGKLGPQMCYVERASKRLARQTFMMMLRYGPKLEKKHMQLMRLVEIATELFAMSATISRAHKLSKIQGHDGVEDLAKLFCLEARQRIEGHFKRLWCNTDVLNRKIANRVMQNKYSCYENETTGTEIINRWHF